VSSAVIELVSGTSTMSALIRFSSMVTIYDRQLHRAPVGVLSLAYERLKYFRTKLRVEQERRAVSPEFR
jgi:hypothetical protein